MSGEVTLTFDGIFKYHLRWDDYRLYVAEDSEDKVVCEWKHSDAICAHMLMEHILGLVTESSEKEFNNGK